MNMSQVKERKSSSEGGVSSGENIDALLDEKVTAVIDTMTLRFLGMRVKELNKDLTEKLITTPFFDWQINTEIPYKEAKKQFKRYYLQKMLSLHLGNISEVAKKAKINRRSLHRLIDEFKINNVKIKLELIKPYDVKVSTISSVIEHTLDSYKQRLHPEKLQQMYRNVPEISQDIMLALPEATLTFSQALKEFEKKYFQKLLEEQASVAELAKKIKIRYETLHRKLKTLGLIAKMTIK